MWIAAIITAVLIAVDQLTKYLALVHLKPIHTTTVIENVLSLTFVENRGVAFGMFSGKRWLILLVTLCIVGAIIYYYVHLPKTKEYAWMRGALILLCAGAFGNILDRMFRGYVVDFFQITLFSWPVFNVADIFVVAGVILLAYLMLFVIKDEPKEKKKRDE